MAIIDAQLNRLVRNKGGEEPKHSYSATGIVWMVGTHKWRERLKPGEPLAGFDHKPRFRTYPEVRSQLEELSIQYNYQEMYAVQLRLKQDTGPVQDANGRWQLGTGERVMEILRTRILEPVDEFKGV